MITAMVQIKLPEPMTRDKAQVVFADTAPKYREVKVAFPVTSNRRIRLFVGGDL